MPETHSQARNPYCLSEQMEHLYNIINILLTRIHHLGIELQYCARGYYLN